MWPCSSWQGEERSGERVVLHVVIHPTRKIALVAASLFLLAGRHRCNLAGTPLGQCARLPEPHQLRRQIPPRDRRIQTPPTPSIVKSRMSWRSPERPPRPNSERPDLTVGATGPITAQTRQRVASARSTPYKNLRTVHPSSKPRRPTQCRPTRPRTKSQRQAVACYPWEWLPASQSCLEIPYVVHRHPLAPRGV